MRVCLQSCFNCPFPALAHVLVAALLTLHTAQPTTAPDMQGVTSNTVVNSNMYVAGRACVCVGLSALREPDWPDLIKPRALATFAMPVPRYWQGRARLLR